MTFFWGHGSLLVVSLLQSEAVVIKTYPLAEADKIVVAYTRKYGKLRGVARGARRLRSRFAGRLELFSWIGISAFERENQDLVQIDKVDLIRSFGLGCGNYRCFLQLNLLGELLIETVPEHEPNEPLFRLLLLVLPEIQDPTRSDLAQLYFEVWHLKLAGLFPSYRTCGQCGVSLFNAADVFYSSALNMFLCGNCKGKALPSISSKSYQLLHHVLTEPLGHLNGSFGLTDGDSRDLADMVETQLQRSFERRFDCLTLVRNQS